MQSMRVFGCDVAPRKGAVVCDGRCHRSFTPPELAGFVRNKAQQDAVLLAWDAPLTGPSNPDGDEILPQDFTQRSIETFFRRAGHFKAPKGISVLSYGGCSHWTITQHVLGLPRTGPFCVPEDDLPYRLLTETNDSCEPAVVEVHPAVAIWLWCREAWARETWEYKRQPDRVRDLWKLLFAQHAELGDLRCPNSDDELDAAVAWLLADKWLREDGVVMLGNRQTGAFLVPAVESIVDSFRNFVANERAASMPPIT